MAKITYTDKVALNANAEIPDINKVKDADMNEIKTSVNVLYDDPVIANSITGSYLTASQILITDANKKIVSAPVATYPSLTELSRVKGVTSAIQTQLNSKLLYSKIITATRDAGAASGDVSYTGVGFVPTSIHCLMTVEGTLFQSDGFSDSAKSSQCKLQSAANVYYNSAQLANYSNRNTFDQYGVVKSYDADGFTLTWTKTGTPTAGTLALTFICYK